MLLLLVLGMLVVLVVLEELVVFVEGIFKNGISPKKIVRNLKNLKRKFLLKKLSKNP